MLSYLKKMTFQASSFQNIPVLLQPMEQTKMIMNSVCIDQPRQYFIIIDDFNVFYCVILRYDRVPENERNLLESDSNGLDGEA